ncbi:hypothetical protein ACFXGA_05250 [Actinosynnema sp. NPDC059335]|uniref:hypothetical protein n=1 Tax=Actinosynnema sp. NPDC059335 TaxID=3346804 RepID=UPI00366A8200
MSDPLGAKIAENREEEPPPGEKGPGRTPRAPGSFRFAATAAGTCLLASLALGFGVIHVPRWFEEPPPPPEAQSPVPTPTGTPSWQWPTDATPTTTRTTPAGYTRSTGPEGLVTVLPDSFEVSGGNGSGTAVARDPDDPEVEVRFGGAAPEGYDDLYDTIARAAADTSRRPGYRQHALRWATHGDVAAVDWDFQHETPQGQTRRTAAHYWRTGGIEYVLLVQAPPGRWTEAARLLATMIDHSDTP